MTAQLAGTPLLGYECKQLIYIVFNIRECSGSSHKCANMMCICELLVVKIVYKVRIRVIAAGTSGTHATARI